MPISVLDAEIIVHDCIRQASGHTGNIRPQDELEDVGIVDDFTIEILVNEIVTNPEIGVRSVGCSISPNALDIDPDTSVASLIGQVVDSSKCS